MVDFDPNFCSTIELGYNDHGYNEYTVITNKMSWLVWFSILYLKKIMVITSKNLRNHGYNEQKWTCDSLLMLKMAFELKNKLIN